MCGCASLQSRPRGDSDCCAPLSQSERIAHVLSRLTFGPRPGDFERIASTGVSRWIDEQLRPDAISDSGVVAALAVIPAWNVPIGELGQLSPLPPRVAAMSIAEATKDSAARAVFVGVRAAWGTPSIIARDFAALLAAPAGVMRGATASEPASADGTGHVRNIQVA